MIRLLFLFSIHLLIGSTTVQPSKFQIGSREFDAVQSLCALHHKMKDNELMGIRNFILFFGSLDDSGESWCSDSREALPRIAQGIQHMKTNDTIIVVFVGDRIHWKDQSNPFRKCEKYKITDVPTFTDVKMGKNLVMKEITEANLKTMFEDTN